MFNKVVKKEFEFLFFYKSISLLLFGSFLTILKRYTLTTIKNMSSIKNVKISKICKIKFTSLDYIIYNMTELFIGDKDICFAS